MRIAFLKGTPASRKNRAFLLANETANNVKTLNFTANPIRNTRNHESFFAHESVNQVKMDKTVGKRFVPKRTKWGCLIQVIRLYFERKGAHK